MSSEVFNLVAPFSPSGDQPQAIDALVKSIEEGNRFTTLLGATGTGKTFTIASVIARLQRPTLVISHNKTLAAQLAAEFREFFPHNAVEYFVSYFDYYQPEAYLPQEDSYIKKDSSLNDELDRLRHSAIQAVLQRRDVLCVSSVSCIYGLGNPEDYQDMLLVFRPGEELERTKLLRRLISMCYHRSDFLESGTFRFKGEILDIYPVGEEKIYRIEFFGDEIEQMSELDPINMHIIAHPERIVITPAKIYVLPIAKMRKALHEIEDEMWQCVDRFKNEGKLLEAQRLKERTLEDLSFMESTGYCTGIENYSRYLTGRQAGEPPYTLVDYFAKDFVVFIDESHVAIPQIAAMLAGDRSRKKNLIEYGFRLPSALDNRPLSMEEFFQKVGQVVFMSATPGKFELEHSNLIVEQIIRPTGLLDPEIEIRPISGQVEDLIKEIKIRSQEKERVLVTTLTKKMAEDLSEYLQEAGVKVRYLHSGIDTLERIEILRDLRLGKFDVLVGINLLREGLDLPEVSLVAILDADKEGFLRSETSLIQTIGRAARNISGKVILYADMITKSMQAAIDETNRRRTIQMEYNLQHNITPQTINKAVKDILGMVSSGSMKEKESLPLNAEPSQLDADQLQEEISQIEKAMLAAAKEMQFELAAALRDKMYSLKSQLNELIESLPVAAALEINSKKKRSRSTRGVKPE